MTIMKICIKHGKLDINQIIKCGIRKDIQRYRCKACQKELHHNNYLKNSESIYERTRKNALMNPEKTREYKRQYYNRQKLQENSR